MDGTHTGKLSAESVRAALRRVRGSALNFVPRGIPGGRNFCPAHAGRNGFPLERGAFATRCSVEERRRKLWRAEKGKMGSFQSVQKVHKKLPQISSILRVQSGRRENLLTKWIYFLLKKGPPNPRRRHGPNKPPAAPTSYCSPAHARQSPGGGQTTYSLHSGGVSDTDSAGSSPFSRRCLFMSRPSVHAGWTGLFLGPFWRIFCMERRK